MTGSGEPSELGQWALVYAELGFPVFPLAPGTKVPLFSKEDGGNGFHDATTDTELIRSWWSLAPDANIGVAVPVGYAVVDVDPRHDGHLTLARLVTEKGVPETRMAKSGRGDGGHHRWYSTNGKEAPTTLGPGLDVKRGGGGYVVAPPSIHPDTGQPYAWVDFAQPIAPLPEWAYDLADPGVGRGEVDPIYDWANLANPNDPGTDFNARGDLTPFFLEAGWQIQKTLRNGDIYWVRPGKAPREGHAAIWHPTTRVFVVWSTETVFPIPPGQDEAGFAPWRVFGYLRHRGPDGEVDWIATASELRGLGFGAQPFADLFTDPATSPAPRELDRTELIWNRLLSPLDVDNLPPPEWLLTGILQVGTLAALVGRPESAKSLLALDWACSVATGSWWQRRHAVKGGPVLYVYGEGTAGLGVRKKAWEAYHRTPLADFPIRWYPRPINLLDTTWADALARVVERLGATLVIIDTVSRAMPGGNENAAEDMGKLITAVDFIRARTPAVTVLLVHHPPRDGEHPRGHSSLDGALDTTIAVKRSEPYLVTLSCEKQKDAAPFDSIRLGLQVMTNSVVLVTPTGLSPDESVTGSEIRALDALYSHFSETGASASEWRAASGLSEATFYRARNGLLRRGEVRKEGSDSRPRYHPTDPEDSHALT